MENYKQTLFYLYRLYIIRSLWCLIKAQPIETTHLVQDSPLSLSFALGKSNLPWVCIGFQDNLLERRTRNAMYLSFYSAVISYYIKNTHSFLFNKRMGIFYIQTSYWKKKINNKLNKNNRRRHPFSI